MNFIEKLENAQRRNNSLICVGLDPQPEKIPACCGQESRYLDFCRAIVDATAAYVCAFKPQAAHFAAVGAEGELAKLTGYIKENYPNIPVILDAKRGDIGSTAEKYALEAFGRYQADAVTVNPYLGGDSLKPFLAWQDRGVVILCRTSNPGGADLQSLLVDGEPLYLRVAGLAADSWNYNGNVLLVVGATWPDELARVRRRVGDLPLLVPGIGAQGGDAAAVIRAGLNGRGGGLIINSSRSIIYAGRGDDFAASAAAAARALRDEINQLRSEVTG